MSFPWTIRRYETCSSTQALLKEEASAGASEGLVVQALSQSGGYGRHGREWVSPSGNLYLSLLLRPACAPAEIASMALVAGVALAEAAARYAPGVMLKWPNDLLIEGRKLSGILLETELSAQGARVEFLVLGVGVNIVSAPPDLGISLHEAAGQPVERDEFRDEFLAQLGALYSQWQREGLAAVRARWLARAHKLGTILKIKLGAGELEGYFEGLDARGNLLLRLENGAIKTVTSGEVHFGDGTDQAYAAGD